MAKNVNKNEIIAHQWDTLRSLWSSCRPGVDRTEQGEIDNLFPDKSTVWSSDAEAWRQFNYAEQRVGAHLDPTLLAVEYETLLDMARNRKASWLATYEEKKGLFADPPPVGATPERQRALYQSLLQSLQSEFIETRFRRTLRRETASRLFSFGVAAILIAFAPLALYFGLVRGGSTSQLIEPSFGLVMVASFGILGAYFSRVLSFQSKLASIGFDDVMNLYQWRMLALRLLYGMIGAIIFYYLIHAELVGGSVFPVLKKLPDGQLNASATILTPTPDLAKLLIWSFLAGFSERLVPDALDRTEAQSKKEG